MRDMSPFFGQSPESSRTIRFPGKNPFFLAAAVGREMSQEKTSAPNMRRFPEEAVEKRVLRQFPKMAGPSGNLLRGIGVAGQAQ